MTQILLVEDDAFLLDVMKTILEAEGYQVTPAPNGRKALDFFEASQPDLIVSDITMPEMDGYALLEAVRAQSSGALVPFLFLSARTERSDVSYARSLGADDFLFKPFDVSELLGAVRAKLERRRIVQLFDTREAHLQTVIMLANVIETRDPYTRGHVERVKDYALKMGHALGWGNEDLVILEFGAILHDVGKIIVPRTVLNKAGPLKEQEWESMREHSKVGAQMLQGIDHLRGAIPYVLCHHEWWDGSGYPEGLSGFDIPREGRLMAIVDVFDAMSSDRPYHKGMSEEKVLEEIHSRSGMYFDPQMTEIFINLFKK